MIRCFCSGTNGGDSALWDSNIAVNGCGPVCLSMVIVSLTGDSEATPDALAKDSDRGDSFIRVRVHPGNLWFMGQINMVYQLRNCLWMSHL